MSDGTSSCERLVTGEDLQKEGRLGDSTSATKEVNFQNLEPKKNPKETLDLSCGPTLRSRTRSTSDKDCKNTKDKESVIITFDELEKETKDTIMVATRLGVDLDGEEDRVSKDLRKIQWINDLRRENRFSFMCIQETMERDGNRLMVNRLWGRGNIEWDWVNSRGNSGGILNVWDRDRFNFLKSIKDDNFLITVGAIAGCQEVVNIVNIYAPQGVGEKKRLWEKLIGWKRSLQGWWILAGDFNEVRTKEERRYSVFDRKGAEEFNKFINDAMLKEYRMGGDRFTYMENLGKSFSKLDRFLVCDKVFDGGLKPR
ncbi:hypothetical protein SSX86_032067 [Deinandra increscens subsp. villosa]|uniref:RNA-directed DNA polymerase, eukaryota n=1 Tax=Deinandra increscens subsp. villosa TaxID=3103831 RepID=A0AAP0C8M2_9ASTR